MPFAWPKILKQRECCIQKMHIDLLEFRTTGLSDGLVTNFGYQLIRNSLRYLD